MRNPSMLASTWFELENALLMMRLLTGSRESIQQYTATTAQYQRGLEKATSMSSLAILIPNLSASKLGIPSPLEGTVPTSF